MASGMPSRSRPPAGLRRAWASPAMSSSTSISAASAAAPSLRTSQVPKDRTEDVMSHGIPITYVPARNTVFLALALAWAETLGAFDIFIGVNCVDYSGYPDCRPEFLACVRAARQSGHTRRRRKPRADSGSMPRCWTLNKEQIIERGRELGVDFSLTHCCYDPAPSRAPVRRCDACRIRRSAFDRLGLDDPIAYAYRPRLKSAARTRNAVLLTSTPTRTVGRSSRFPSRSDCARRRAG